MANIKPLTKSQAVCIMVYTGVVIMDPKEFRRQIEMRLGRETQPNEYTDPDFIETLMELYEEDFRVLCQTTEDSGLITLN